MTDAELKALVANLAVSQKETDRQMKETDRQMKETDRQMKETDRQMKETDRQMKETDRKLKELGCQIGGLGNKFGSFTEGLMWPSLTRMLFEDFGCDTVMPATLKRRASDGTSFEVDALGYANGEVNRVVVVEVKSHLADRDLDQFERILERFAEYFPEHRGKTLEGIVAAADIKDTMAREVARRGLHLARAGDESFQLADPAGFEPRRRII